MIVGGRETLNGFISEVRLQLLEDPTLGASEIFCGTYFREEFLE